MFPIFLVHEKNGLRWPQIGPGGFLFLLIQTLPTFWAERIWILIFLCFWFFWIPKLWISRSPNLKMSGSPACLPSGDFHRFNSPNWKKLLASGTGPRQIHHIFTTDPPQMHDRCIIIRLKCSTFMKVFTMGLLWTFCREHLPSTFWGKKKPKRKNTGRTPPSCWTWAFCKISLIGLSAAPSCQILQCQPALLAQIACACFSYKLAIHGAQPTYLPTNGG